MRKGVNLAGIDPQTGDVAVLFHPRNDAWADHFEIRMTGQHDALEICGKTPQGRATVFALRMNGESAWLARRELWREGALGEEISDKSI